MFKLLSTLFLFATAAFAQSAYIGLPVAGQTVAQGGDLVVQIIQPDNLDPYQEIAVVIGLESCPNCGPPSESMGTILYNGPFDPQFNVIPGTLNLPPYQNFTVQIPSTTQTGTALIGVAHYALINLANVPFTEFLNQTITIVSA